MPKGLPIYGTESRSYYECTAGGNPVSCPPHKCKPTNTFVMLSFTIIRLTAFPAILHKL